VFLVHGTQHGASLPALVHSKYLVDSPEDLPHTDAIAKSRYVFEQGKFYGVQAGTRAIALYAPRILEHPGSVAPAIQNRFRSAKVIVEFARRAGGSRVWAGSELVDQFPRDLAEGTVVVAECGQALVAIRPLSRDDLGFDAPLRLVEQEDRLVLEMYNYLGPETVFWDLDRESRFFQGKPRAGFYAEVARASEYPDGAAFARAVAAGDLQDAAEPPVTSYHDSTERLWTVAYSRGEERLGISIDLIHWALKRRWNQDGDMGWPLLESSLARQTTTGWVEVGGATITCGEAPAWLVSLPDAGYYVAGYHGDPAPFELRTPLGTVSLEQMGSGTVTWCDRDVTIDAIHAGMPKITKFGG